MVTKPHTGPIEIPNDGLRLLLAWKTLAERERDFYLREIEAAALFWASPQDSLTPAFLKFMKTALDSPAQHLPPSFSRALDTTRVRQFANEMVERIEEACAADPDMRMRLAHAFAKSLASSITSEDREERCGAQLALSAVIVQLVQLASEK